MNRAQIFEFFEDDAKKDLGPVLEILLAAFPERPPFSDTSQESTDSHLQESGKRMTAVMMAATVLAIEAGNCADHGYHDVVTKKMLVEGAKEFLVATMGIVDHANKLAKKERFDKKVAEAVAKAMQPTPPPAGG